MSAIEEPADQVIELMVAAERALPEKFLGVRATWDFAQVLAEIEGHLTSEQTKRLIGVGAVIIRLGRDEALAGIQAHEVLQGIMAARNG